MFDAGSSGTRVYVYSWSCRANQTMAYINITEKALEYKVEPGIDSFAKDLDGLKNYIDELIQFAYENVPYTMHKYTPIMLAATAGVRMIPAFFQFQIINTIRDIFRSSKFLFHKDEWCRVISGQEEGAYMWLSINYMIGKLGITDTQHALTIDLGGGSTQLAFKPETNIDINEMNLKIPNHNQYKIFSISYLYYGIDQAKKLIFQKEIEKLDEQQLVYQSPCFPYGYNNPYRYNNTYRIIGLGDINECRQLIQRYLNNDISQCKYQNCGINGLYQPEIDSELIYVIGGMQFMAEFLELTDFTLEEYFIRAVKFCSKTQDELMAIPQYRNNRYSSGNYFTVLYVYELLKHGYGIKENQIIKAPQKIGNITPSWTLAAMFYQISQIDCEKDSPVCSTIMNQ